MISNKGKVLVLGSDTRSFLTIIRSLGRKGIEVHVAFCDPGAIALNSKYIHKKHFSIHTHGKLAVDKFVDLMRVENFDLVIPTSDAIHAQIYLCRDLFVQFNELPILPKSCYETTSSKLLTVIMAEKLGISVSKYKVIGRGKEYSKSHAGFNFPIVIKPLASVALNDPSHRLIVKKAFTEEEYQELMPKMLKASDVVIQENFAGVGTGVECLAKDGEILTAFQHQREHEPLHGGGSSYRKSVPLNDEMYSAAVKFTKELNYTGVIMYEFKLNETTGKWIIIEINARFWGSLPLAVSAGIDFPYYYYQMIVQGRTAFNRDYKPSYCRNFELDMWWFLANLKADRNDPLLATKPLYKVFTEILHVITFKEHFDTLTLDDPVPGLVELKQLFSMLFRKVSSRLIFKMLNFKFICKMRRKYVLTRYKNANSIIFMCKGNICRSPFAESYFAKKYPHREVQSAGVIPQEGRHAPDPAKEAAKRFKIQLEPHRSRALSKSLLSKADLVIFFDRANYESLLSISLANAGKYLPMTALLESVNEIEDPYGSETEGFVECYRQISKAIDALP